MSECVIARRLMKIRLFGTSRKFRTDPDGDVTFPSSWSMVRELRRTRRGVTRFNGAWRVFTPFGQNRSETDSTRNHACIEKRIHRCTDREWVPSSTYVIHKTERHGLAIYRGCRKSLAIGYLDGEREREKERGTMIYDPDLRERLWRFLCVQRCGVSRKSSRSNMLHTVLYRASKKVGTKLRSNRWKILSEHALSERYERSKIIGTKFVF